MDVVHPANLVIHTEQVQLPTGGAIVVRGLNLPDILHIYRQHSAQFEELYHLAQMLPPATSAVDLVADLLTNAEPIAMEVIACAIGGQQHLDAARNLAASVQLIVLLTCFNLTVEKEGGLEKLVGSVIQMLGLLNRAKSLFQPHTGLQDTVAK